MRKTLILDESTKRNQYTNLIQHLRLKKMLFVPVISKREIIGIVGLGSSKEGFSFSEEDVEIVHLFSQNVTLVWEHERLSTKVGELEIFDNLTGLYNKKMLIQRLDEEIKRTSVYQRPCGFITVEVLDYQEYLQSQGIIPAERILKKIAKAFRSSLKSIDIAGRIDAANLGAILIESNKRQSQELLENLQSSLSQVCGDEIKLAFSVASAPIDGVCAKELIEFAKTNKHKSD